MTVGLDDPTTGPRGDLLSLPTERLEAAIIALAAEANAARYRLLKLLAAYDQRGAWVAWGATSCAAWWAEVAQLELATAREHLRVARALDELPALDAALADGRLSYAKAKVLSRVADVDTVDELVTLAQLHPAGRLGIVLAGWAAGRLSPDAVADAQYQARRVSFRTEPDGMITAVISLPPRDGAALRAAIDRLVAAGDAPAGASVPQLRADAVTRLVAGNGVTGAPASEVLIHVHAGPEGAVIATLDDGTPVPDPELGSVLCEATVRALVHDSAGQPVDASPGRPAPSRRQRRLLQVRDRHCQYPGCRASSFPHAHHVVPREHGGPTIMANLVLVCSFHHRLLHRRGDGWRPDWWNDEREAEVRRALTLASRVPRGDADGDGRREPDPAAPAGGGDGIRTHDLRLAKPPL